MSNFKDINAFTHYITEKMLTSMKVVVSAFDPITEKSVFF